MKIRGYFKNFSHDKQAKSRHVFLGMKDRWGGYPTLCRFLIHFSWLSLYILLFPKQKKGKWDCSDKYRVQDPAWSAFFYFFLICSHISFTHLVPESYCLEYRKLYEYNQYQIGNHQQSHFNQSSIRLKY